MPAYVQMDVEQPEKVERCRCCKCFLKTIFCPCLLVFMSCRIYLCGCLWHYLGKCLRCIFCWICLRKCGCCKYTDSQFPPNGMSLGGKWQFDTSIRWLRMEEVARNLDPHLPPVLFHEGINPSDIQQGGVGNCWLMSALACMAEFPGALQNCFTNGSMTWRGKYSVRLFDEARKQHTVTVDDHIPTRDGRPIFAFPKKNEMWVLVMEKAVAKFQGGYDNTNGAQTAWGLTMLTGDPCFSLKRKGPGHWIRENLEFRREGTGRRACYLREAPEAFNVDRLFRVLREYDEKRAVLGASAHHDTSRGDSKDGAICGIVQGHAYTVMEVREVGGGLLSSARPTRLVRLRNPWGNFEWKGRWSDKSPLWQQHPHVRKAVGFRDADDGCFWMEFCDFESMYDSIDVCDRSTGSRDLALDRMEAKGCCGPLCGCVAGCCRFWLCCEGVRALFGRRGTGRTREGKSGCCSCC